MNPFFEQRWRGAHTALLTYLRDVLQEQLPADLIAAPEEDVIAVGAGGVAVTDRPDVQVREPWVLKEPAVVEGAQPPALALTRGPEPLRVFVAEEVERWLEVRESTGRLITVVELLSPTNKLESTERDRYLRKRRAFTSGAAITCSTIGSSSSPRYPPETASGRISCCGNPACSELVAHRSSAESP